MRNQNGSRLIGVIVNLPRVQEGTIKLEKVFHPTVVAPSNGVGRDTMAPCLDPGLHTGYGKLWASKPNENQVAVVSGFDQTS